MKTVYRNLKLMAIASAAGFVWGGSCLVENFWADKWSEIVNRAIFGAINAALANTAIGAI